MTQTTNPYPHQVRSVAAITVLYIFRMLGLFMVLPVLALYGEDYRFATPILIGLALGVYGLSQALLQIPFGLASDRWGRRPIIAVGLCLFVLGSVVAAYAETIYGLIAGRLLQGTGAIAGALMALVADVTSEQNRTKAMAAVGASIGLSFAVALVLGPILTAAAGGLNLIFAITAGCGLVGLVIVFTLLPKPAAEAANSRHQTRTNLLMPTLFNPHLLRLNGGIFVLHFVLMASFLVVPNLLETTGIDRTQHWQVYLGLLLVSFFLMLPLVMAAERRGYARQVFISAVALLAVSELTLVVLQVNTIGLLSALFLFLLAFNVLEASLPSLLSKTAPESSRGTASGIYSTSQFFGAFLGGALGGVLYTWWGPEGVLWVGAILIGLWWLATLGMTHPQDVDTIVVAQTDSNLTQQINQLVRLPGVVSVAADGDRIELKINRHRFSNDSIKPKSSDRQENSALVALDNELV